MGKTYVFGDVHGCLAELMDLWFRCEVSKTDDNVVFLGDLLDKGEWGTLTLRFVRALIREGYRITVLAGNHEESNLRYLKWLFQLSEGSKHPMTDRWGDMAANSKVFQQDPSWLPWLESLPLGFQTGSFLCVHAGIPASMVWLPDMSLPISSLPPKERDFANKNLRIRHIFPDTGEPCPRDKVRPGFPFWANSYEGRFGTVIFGHTVCFQDSPKMFPHAIGIDLGCVFGGWLCALVLEDDKVIDYITVRAKREYCPRAHEDI